MKRKLKQVICVLLGTMLFCTARVGAYTECETEYSGEISPQYEEIVVLGVPPPTISAISPSLRCSHASLNPLNLKRGLSDPLSGNISASNAFLSVFRASILR